jgi:hypothetical protein
MSLRVIAASGLFVGLLAACGPSAPKEGTASINPVKGEAVVNLGKGEMAAVSMKAPANLPPYAPAYPGATVQSSVAGIGGTTGGMLAMMSADAPDQIMAFYKKAADGAGLKTVNETTSATRSTFMARDGEKNVGVNLSTVGPGRTMVQVLYK